MEWLKIQLEKIIDWHTRRRPAEYILLFSGAMLTAKNQLGWYLAISYSEANGFSFGPGQAPSLTDQIINWAGVAMMIVALAMISYGWVQDLRKKVLVIELRGLRDFLGKPLRLQIPRLLVGRREDVLIDIRGGGADGKQELPTSSYEKLSYILKGVSPRLEDHAREDVSIVVGGLAPVPFLFYAGMSISDQTDATLMDWDRNKKCWRILNDADDGDRFQVTGLEDVCEGADEVALVVSMSYLANIEAVEQEFSDMPIVHMRAATNKVDRHFSDKKQEALVVQFQDTVSDLLGKGVKRIHLIPAVPSSLAVRMGMNYDRRLKPFLTAYQYERDGLVKYPWGLVMPVDGDPCPGIILTTSS